MPNARTTILLVDPDARARAQLANQLGSLDCTLLEAGDAPEALRLVRDHAVALIVTELYLPTADAPCLIEALRRDEAHRDTRIVAHTHRSLAADREWALHAGADAYLIKPTRAQRVRHVVMRLGGPNVHHDAAAPHATSVMMRRDSLDAALDEIEKGNLADTSCIVFGRAWWDALAGAQRTAFRRRAKRAHVSLRSDSLLGNHFVEVRGPSRHELGLSTERPESPYRR